MYIYLTKCKRQRVVVYICYHFSMEENFTTERNPHTCFILVGIQASGKTAFAHQHLANCSYVSLDQLNTRNKEQIVLENTLKTGANCVVDNTNPTREERKKYLDLAKANGYKVVGIYFRSAVAECAERNAQRTGKAQVPLKAILATAKRLEQPSYADGFDELYYVKIENNDFVVSKWDETV